MKLWGQMNSWNLKKRLRFSYAYYADDIGYYYGTVHGFGGLLYDQAGKRFGEGAAWNHSLQL